VSEYSFHDRREDGAITAAEVEAYASACWDILLGLEIQCGHSKSYDPMTIDETKKVAHSYVFDLWDGGRHHQYESLEQVWEAVRKETLEAIKEYFEPTTEEPAP